MGVSLFVLQKVILNFSIIMINNQVYKPKFQEKISQNSFYRINFPKILILKFINKVSENDSSDNQDYSYFVLEKSLTNTNLSLYLLFFSFKLALNTFF